METLSEKKRRYCDMQHAERVGVTGKDLLNQIKEMEHSRKAINQKAFSNNGPVEKPTIG